MGTSHEIPTTAPPPPAAGLKSATGQCCSSPTRRNRVTARLIRKGTKISFEIVVPVSSCFAVIGGLLWDEDAYRSSLRSENKLNADDCQTAPLSMSPVSTARVPSLSRVDVGFCTNYSCLR